MGVILIISFAFISIILFGLRIWYFKLSVKDVKPIQRGYYGRGLIDFSIATQVFFPISIKFKDDIKVRELKKKANNFLCAFYISFGVTIVILSIFDK